MMISRSHSCDGSRAAVLLSITALTIAHWAVLVFHFPDLSELRGWPYLVRPKPVGGSWLVVLMIAAAAAVLYYVVRLFPARDGSSESAGAIRAEQVIQPAVSAVSPTRRREVAIGLALIVGLGSFLQFGFAGLEGRGLAPIRERIVESGHAEFAQIAVTQDSLWRVVKNYESLSDRQELGLHAPSKPPGQLLLYMLTERLANFGDVYQPRGFRLRRLQTLATYLWPVISALVTIPLFFLTRAVFDERRAMVACVLCVFVPSLNLIELHADQVFFPTFFVGTVLLSAMAVRRDSLGWSVAAGTAIYLAIFCTFGLLFSLPVSLCVCLVLSRDPVTSAIDVRRFLRVSAYIVTTTLVVDGAFRLVIGYDVALRYQKAVHYHLAWKTWVPGWENVAYYGMLNQFEFALWIGLPLTVLAWFHFGGAVLRTVRLRIDRAALLSWTVFGVVFALAFLGRTKNEVARLWLFMVPLFCLLAADQLETRFRGNGNVPLFLIALLQGGTVYVVKIMQDF